ncbi:MAG: hypothetical protein IJX24_05000 [Oscillospiraceae bacterium]|nr:hypothetical protein [Oscillospiraceae bacterium]
MNTSTEKKIDYEQMYYELKAQMETEYIHISQKEKIEKAMIKRVQTVQEILDDYQSKLETNSLKFDKETMKTKHITSFDEWSEKSEPTQTS